MIRPGSTPAQRRQRLPEQSRVPAIEDIEFLYSEAAKQPGQLIEMPWTINRQQFSLTAKLERRNNEQSHQWSFYRGDGPHSKLVWNYESSDITMVHSLVMTAFPDAEKVRPDPTLLDTLQLKPDEEPPAPMGRLGGAQTATEQVVPMPAAQPPHRKIMGVMEGNLAEMPLPSLLNSIQSSRLSGRLAIQSHSPSQAADMFFEEGALVSCRRHNLEGEEAFLELALNSTVGDFRFFDTDKCQSRTINVQLEALLLKAAALADHSRYLDRQGLRPDSALLRSNPNLTEKGFEEALANAVPVDMSLQKRLYQAIDGCSLTDLLNTCGLRRSTWTPLIFNLVNSGLIKIDNPVVDDPLENKNEPNEPVSIDLVALEKFTATMTRPDTGIYSEIAFLFFLEHEFYRFHSYETPFTIVLFKLISGKGEVSHDALKAMLEAVKNTVRKADILGHYEGNDYALILPHTDPIAAAGLIARLKALISQPPFPPDEFKLAIGTAGIPDDCQDLISLLSIARLRKNSSAG